MDLKSGRKPNFKNFKISDLGFPRKMTFGCSPMDNHIEYYKGEGDDFPQVQAMVILVSLCLFMARLCTKSVTTTH
jgi:hypothetical protein